MHADRRIATDSPAAGSYLTDGRRLLRVVSLPDRSRRWRTAVLEDCRTLELREFRRRDFRRLRPVGSRRLTLRSDVADTAAATAAGRSPEGRETRSGVPAPHERQPADARP
jgi:hypothetical protein